MYPAAPALIAAALFVAASFSARAEWAPEAYPAVPQIPGVAMPGGQTAEQIHARGRIEHERMLAQIEVQRQQNRARTGPLRTAPSTLASYPFSNDARPFAPVKDPALDRASVPPQVQLQHETYRKQMDAQRAERRRWADEQRKAAEEQLAAMRKEMESFRLNRKI